MYILENKKRWMHGCIQRFSCWLALALGSRWPALSRIALRAKIFVGIAFSEW